MSSPTSSPSSGVAAPIVDGLQQVLLAHHAAVFGYPVLGTHLDDDAQIGQARAEEAAHRLSRDAVAAQLVALGATPAASAATYAVPAPLTSGAAAGRWAVTLEAQTAAAYRYLLLSTVRAGGAQKALRTQAIAGLTGAASSGLYWRRLVSPATPTVPFPGA